MKKRQYITLQVLIFLVILSSCSNPLHCTYNPGTYEDDLQAIRNSNKVSDEDLETLAKYILVVRLSGNDITGKSYNDILDKIKSVRQNTDELKNRSAMEKDERRKRLSPFLEVRLQNKIFVKKNDKNVLLFTVLFKNSATKKIKTVTGDLTVNDLMEKPVKDLSIFLDEDILPGQTLTKTYTCNYNDTDENDRNMRSKDLFDIRAVWNPEKIIFENGKLAE